MQYNSRSQVTEIKLGNWDVSDSVLKLNYLYGTVASVDADGQIVTSQNNGNIGRVKYTIGGSLKHSQTFQYDELNRIKFGVEHDNGVLSDATRAWWQTFDYDRWGNRGLNTTGSNTSANMAQSGSALGIGEFSASTNRITKVDHGYDAAGNLEVAPGRLNDIFDGENKLISSTVDMIPSTYVYDANGRRVKKTVGVVVTKFVYNAAGQLIAEYGGSGPPPGFSLHFATADHLGSPRVWTNGGWLATNGRHDYAPFGEELGPAQGTVRTGLLGYSATSQADGQKKQFAGYERDSETSLDFAQARYFSSKQGRFTSPDEPFVDQHEGDPQTWNLYAFVGNNPLRYSDPTGLWKEIATGVWEWENDKDTWETLAAKLNVGAAKLRARFPGVVLGIGLALVPGDLEITSNSNTTSDMPSSAEESRLSFGTMMGKDEAYKNAWLASMGEVMEWCRTRGNG